MAFGSGILIDGAPKGKFETIIVSGTPLPGTFMEIVPAVLRAGGRFQYRNVTRASGALGPVAILLDDWMQGKLATDIYVAGTLAVIYWPLPGEEMNALLAESSGTGTANEENVGDLLAIRNGGLLEYLSGASSNPFLLLDKGEGSTYGNTLVPVKKII